METRVRGVVLEAFPNVTFRVELEDGKEIRAYLAGRLKQRFIRILIGDTVEMVKPEQSDIARIVRRL